MRKQILFSVGLALVGAFMFFLEGCGEDKIDPCKSKKPVTSNFEIYESQQLKYPDGYKPVNTDTVVTDWVEFNALEENATYLWTLGKEIVTTKSFKRFGFPRGQNIEVFLKVTKNPDRTCFPDDDGIDSVKKTFYVTRKYLCDSKVSGTYEGSNTDDPKNKRTILIDVCAKYPPEQTNAADLTELRIVNLTPNCNNFAFELTFITYKHAMFGYTIDCLNPTGLVKISGFKNDSINIDYTVLKDPKGSFVDVSNKSTKKFRGVRKL